MPPKKLPKGVVLGPDGKPFVFPRQGRPARIKFPSKGSLAASHDSMANSCFPPLP